MNTLFNYPNCGNANQVRRVKMVNAVKNRTGKSYPPSTAGLDENGNLLPGWVKCYRESCGFVWKPRVTNPRACPQCKHYDWRKPSAWTTEESSSEPLYTDMGMDMSMSMSMSASTSTSTNAKPGRPKSKKIKEESNGEIDTGQSVTPQTLLKKVKKLKKIRFR